MSEEENPANPLRDALEILRKPRPFVPGPYDAYEVHPLTKDDNEALRDREEREAFDEASLVHTLVERLVRPIGSEEILAPAATERLTQDHAFLEQLITRLPELYDARGAFVYRDAQRGIADSPHTDPFVERLPDEGPAAFLLRAWREYEKREKEMRAILSETLKSTFLSNTLSAAGQQSLAASISASDNLSKLIDRMKTSPDPAGLGFAEPREFPPFHLPPNPVHETNAHLEAVAGAVADLRELASQTAVMQQSLNAVATEILEKFAQGARDNSAASAQTLAVANKSLWVAIASIAIAIILAVAQIVTSGPSRAELDHQQRMERLSRQEAAAAGTQTRLLQDMVQQLEAEKAQTERLAAEARTREANLVKAIAAPATK